jgi:cell division protein FtsL
MIRGTAERSELSHAATLLHKPYTELRNEPIRIETKVDEMDKRLTARIDILFWAIGVLIAIILAVIALPQLLGYFQEKKARVDFQKRIEKLEQLIEQQQQEIEALKSRRVL